MELEAEQLGWDGYVDLVIHAYYYLKKMKSILICPRKVDNIRHRHPGFSQYGMYRERKASEGFCEGNFSRGEPGQNVLWQL